MKKKFKKDKNGPRKKYDAKFQSTNYVGTEISKFLLPVPRKMNQKCLIYTIISTLGAIRKICYNRSRQ